MPSNTFSWLGDHAKYVKQYKNAGIPVFQPYLEENPKGIKLGGFSIKPFDLEHDVPCYGFYITHREIAGCMIYATDTSYIKYKFNNLAVALVEANYSKEILSDQAMNFEHVLKGHMELETTLNFISTNDNPLLKNVILCHLSNGNADQNLFTQRAKETIKYGANVQVAIPGLAVPLGQECPFI